MYRRILVAVENSGADRTIIDHVSQLARVTGAELLLVHVADGWAARNFDQLKLRESEEMKADRDYLEHLRADLVGRGLTVETRLAMGCSLALALGLGETKFLDLDTPLLLSEDPLHGGYEYQGPKIKPCTDPGLGAFPSNMPRNFVG